MASNATGKKRCNKRGSFAWRKKPNISNLQKFSSYDELPDFRHDIISTSDYSSCSSESSRGCISFGIDSICSDSNYQSDLELDLESDSDASDEEIKRDTRRTRTVHHKNITVIIPENNLSGYKRDEFYLEFIYDPVIFPGDCRTTQVSDIVSVEPHGARFFEDCPALIYLPVHEKITANDKIICLCSNTPKETPPQWEQIPQENFTFKNGCVVIKAYHFSLFTVVAERPFPETWKRITPDGGIIRVNEVPGVEVYFPDGALVQDVTAFVRVLYDSEPIASGGEARQALASPIIMIGPHGCHFNPGSDSVTVRLPIPHYDEIRHRFRRQARLSVWQSATTEGEPLVWERLDVIPVIEQDFIGLYTICFPVSHFSFFKVLWDVLTSSMYEAKLGVAYFYPYISFSMMCQAWMEENKDTQRFALEVICYRSDKKLPEATNYRYKVGRSLKPKLVKPGCITVRLKSELFEADTDAGEDPSLTKLDPDFRGREFEKQFACRFRQEKTIADRGAFGKVIVERRLREGQNEPLFEFNLHKTGVEAEPVPPDFTDRWSVVAIKELASTLHITDDNNWKKFARHIGFTKNEIHSKLLYSADPFMAMVNLYQTRGGTPEEFVQALYEISRELQIKESPGSARGSSSSPGGSSSGASSSRKWRLWNLTPRKWRDVEKDDSDTGASEPSISSHKRSNPSGSSGGSAAKRRRRFSDVSETMSSSEESGVDANELRTNQEQKLSDTALWEISALMNTVNWRALGRTLGLEENVLHNIEHVYKNTGFRECAYQMLLEWKGRHPQKCTFGQLYGALCKESMNAVAKQLTSMKLES